MFLNSLKNFHHRWTTDFSKKLFRITYAPQTNRRLHINNNRFTESIRSFLLFIVTRYRFVVILQRNYSYFLYNVCPRPSIIYHIEVDNHLPTVYRTYRTFLPARLIIRKKLKNTKKKKKLKLVLHQLCTKVVGGANFSLQNWDDVKSRLVGYRLKGR